METISREAGTSSSSSHTFQPSPGLSRLQMRRNSGALKLDCAAVLQQSAHMDTVDTPDISVKFDMLEQIGRGSKGVVHSAIRRDDGERVALKITDASDAEALAMARAEYDTMRLIRHPNIVQAYDFITTRNSAAIVMELFIGVNLSDAVAQEPIDRFSEEVSHRLFKQLLQAVDCLHQHRIVHRDIKPENVLVAPDCLQCRLVDFNTARRLTEGSALSPTGSRLYMPPEARWGEPPSEASDVWALGLCLHLMLSGTLPTWTETPLPGTRYTVSLDKIVASEPCKVVLQQCLTERLMRPAAMILLEMPWTKAMLGYMEPGMEQSHSVPEFRRARSISDSDLSSGAASRDSSIATSRRRHSTAAGGMPASAARWGSECSSTPSRDSTSVERTPCSLRRSSSGHLLERVRNGGNGEVREVGELISADLTQAQGRAKSSRTCLFFKLGVCQKGRLCDFSHDEVCEPCDANVLGLARVPTPVKPQAVSTAGVVVATGASESSAARRLSL